MEEEYIDLYDKILLDTDDLGNFKLGIRYDHNHHTIATLSPDEICRLIGDMAFLLSNIVYNKNGDIAE